MNTAIEDLRKDGWLIAIATLSSRVVPNKYYWQAEIALPNGDDPEQSQKFSNLTEAVAWIVQVAQRIRDDSARA